MGALIITGCSGKSITTPRSFSIPIPSSISTVVPSSTVPLVSSITEATPFPTTLPVLSPEYKIVAQKKLEKLHGRVSFSASTIGKINGKDYLFVGINKTEGSIDSLPGILIFDIQNPLDPTEVSYLPASDANNGIAGLALYNDLLYVSVWDHLWIVNVSVPSSPRSQSQVMDIQTDFISISGKYLFINNNVSTATGNIGVVDISNPTDPRVLGGVNLSPAYNLSHFKIYRSLLYTFAQNGYDRNISLHIVDISTPGSLKEAGTFRFDGSNSNSSSIPSSNSPLNQPLPPMASSSQYDIVFAGHYAYIATPAEGLWVMDMSYPVAPKKVAVFAKPEALGTFRSYRLYISDDLVYLISRSVTIIDVSNPINSKEVGSIPLPINYYGLTKSSQYIYYFITYPPGIEVMDASISSE